MRTSVVGILFFCVLLLGMATWGGCGKRGTSATMPAAPMTCEYEGNEYQVGETFPAGDGCNTCTCMESGEVGCTRMACPCDPDAEPHRSYVSTDPEMCEAIRIVCEAGMQPFFNACGCGCEPIQETSP